MREKRLVFHPLFLAIYPILFLYNFNIGKLAAIETVYPIGISFLFSCVLWFFISKITREREASGLIVTFFIGLFFLYQPVFQVCSAFINDSGEAQSHLNSQLLIIFSLIWIGGSLFLYWAIDEIRWLTSLLNIASLFLLVSLVFTVSNKLIHQAHEDESLATKQTFRLTPKGVSGKPNFYHIVLDAYGRSDILKDLYQMDNLDFINGLKSRGFYVAEDAHSNYCQTLLSLTSLFNMTYLDPLTEQLGKRSMQRGPLQHLLQHNIVFQSLSNIGYKTIAFSSGYSGTDMSQADDKRYGPGNISEFQNLLLSMSPIPPILDKLPFQYLRNLQYDAHRNRIRFTLSEIGSVSQKGIPTFTFAHVVTPHPPFVFENNGSSHNPERPFSYYDGSDFYDEAKGTRDEYIAGYREQLRYLDTLVLKSLDSIIEHDPTAIIIIHGDHGPGAYLDWASLEGTNSNERLSILSAYRVPEEVRKKLYPTITPVNSYRLIFNAIFGADLPLLKDESFYSKWKEPYNFQHVDVK